MTMKNLKTKILRLLLSYFKGYNVLLNKEVASIGDNILCELSDINIKQIDLQKERYLDWVNIYFPDYKVKFNYAFHKKIIELYSSWAFLEILNKDVYMDVGGGEYTYINSINAHRKILQDIRISKKLMLRMSTGIEFLECSAGDIKIQNHCVDKISCHHAFEHFQGDTDILFIKEVQRILQLNGICVIVPFFIGDKYIECSDRSDFNKFNDQSAKHLVDITATLPGGEFSGSFARIYNPEAFKRRILNNIELERFNVQIVTILIDNHLVPDMQLTCHKKSSKINFPYRCLIIKRMK